MSVLNNENTLRHYGGSVWLTKPGPPGGKNALQGIAVCVQKGGEFVAVDYLQLAADGMYLKNGKPVGRWQDESLAGYLQKATGGAAQDEAAQAREVAEAYGRLGSIPRTAAALHLSEHRVRRVLVTAGLYTSPLVRQVAWLHDEGRGKTVAAIAEILGVSEETVRAHLPYEKREE